MLHTQRNVRIFFFPPRSSGENEGGGVREERNLGKEGEGLGYGRRRGIRVEGLGLARIGIRVREEMDCG